MGRPWIPILPIALWALAQPWLATGPVWAGTYKCLGLDGHISYQQTPCPLDTDGTALVTDNRPPSGAEVPGASETYGVERQIKALESAREQARKGRDPAPAAARQARTSPDAFDPARCAKHRAEVARWRQAIRDGYRDRDEKEQEAQMLKHHEALVTRYCQPER
jgi:hypothetical protein